jgi:lariat debranching enzyme
MFKLAQLANSPVDLFMSHDWPQGIEHHGNLQQLLRMKPFFKADIHSGKLGSPPLMQLLKTIRPKHWFSAHLHVRFQASLDHAGLPQQAKPVVEDKTLNPDEILIDDFSNTDEIVIDVDVDVDTVGDISEPKLNQGAAPEVAYENPDKIDIEGEGVGSANEISSPTARNIDDAPSLPTPLPTRTDFIALDKCLPNRKFLEVGSTSLQ